MDPSVATRAEALVADPRMVPSVDASFGVVTCSSRPFVPRRGYGGNLIFFFTMGGVRLQLLFTMFAVLPCSIEYMTTPPALAWGVASLARRMHMSHFRHWILDHTAHPAFKHPMSTSTLRVRRAPITLPAIGCTFGYSRGNEMKRLC